MPSPTAAAAFIADTFGAPHIAAASATALVLCAALALVVRAAHRRRRRRAVPRLRVHSARTLFQGGASVRDVRLRTGLCRDAAVLLHRAHHTACFAGQRQDLPRSAPVTDRLVRYGSSDATRLYSVLAGGTPVAPPRPGNPRGGRTR